MEIKSKSLTRLPNRAKVNIEFQDLTYSIPQGRKGPGVGCVAVMGEKPRASKTGKTALFKPDTLNERYVHIYGFKDLKCGSKVILRSINGKFQPGKLSAILGPSGAGKSTLLNILAGYRCPGATGTITINEQPRNMKEFRKISRYILQENLLQPLLTVQENMLIAADLKLRPDVVKEEKLSLISEILGMLRLEGAKHTITDRLSGGERKRLSVALELINNPPVIFLDEPTTGLDDLSSSQCISLLKLVAQGGRTVVCSIHCPSARLFEMFDHVYIVAAGQCVYQGLGSDIVPFLRDVGLDCPTHYNPADFIIEVVSGEYGDHVDKLVTASDNGRAFLRDQENDDCFEQGIRKEKFCDEIMFNECEYDSSGWRQFKILMHRMFLQMFRNTKHLALKIFLYIFLALMVGCIYFQMGNDGSKTIFNFGFCFTVVIVFMYCPLLPILLSFPMEVQLIKREYFNRWYRLAPYFFARTVVNIPLQVVAGMLFVGLSYFLTSQPMEILRMAMFFTICMMIAFISESIGLAISSTLNILNGMFVGPTLLVPLMLLAVYGMGTGGNNIPFLIRMAMSLSYLRYGMEGLVVSIYGGDRPNLPCPEEEEYCMYVSPKHLLNDMGMGNSVYWFDITMLSIMYIVMKATSFYLLRQRLRPNKTFAALHVILRLVKSHFSAPR